MLLVAGMTFSVSAEMQEYAFWQVGDPQGVHYLPELHEQEISTVIMYTTVPPSGTDCGFVLRPYISGSNSDVSAGKYDYRFRVVKQYSGGMYSAAIEVWGGSKTKHYNGGNAVIFPLESTLRSSANFDDVIILSAHISQSDFMVIADSNIGTPAEIYFNLDFGASYLPQDFVRYELLNYSTQTDTEGILYVDFSPQPITNSGLGSGPQVFITLPRDGFTQSQINAISMYVTFDKIPYNGNSQDLTINITGYRSDRPKSSQFLSFEEGEGVCSGTFKTEGAVLWNEPVTLTVTLTDYEGITYSDSITVTCYEDFIDENEDGFDDRTGQDQWDFNGDYGNDPDSQTPDNLNLVEWLEYFGSSVSEIFAMLNNFFKDFSESGKQFFGFFGVVFSFLPPEILTLLILLFTVVILLRVFGR